MSADQRGSAVVQGMRASEVTAPLPPMVCFRVTRFCNALCSFCLAPPDGGTHPALSALKQRVDWLLARGVRTMHFCGGEPTIHRDLAELISYVKAQGGKSKLTTNGIAVSPELIATMRTAGTQVKVSLHGDRAHHDAIVGREAFVHTTESIQRLVTAGITTSIQTTVVSGHLEVARWMIDYCIGHKLRRLSILPFIPRGSGLDRQDEYSLSASEKYELTALVKKERRRLGPRLDLRLLDFNTRPIHVVEPDGRVVLEGESESADVLLGRI